MMSSGNSPPLVAVEPVPFIACIRPIDVETRLHDVGVIAALLEWKANLRGARELGVTVPLLHFGRLARIFGLPSRLDRRRQRNRRQDGDGDGKPAWLEMRPPPPRRRDLWRRMCAGSNFSSLPAHVAKKIHDAWALFPATAASGGMMCRSGSSR